MILIKKVIVKIFFLAIIFSCNLIEINPKHNNMNKTPFAKKIKVTHKEHNDNREDNYFWLKNRDDNDVIDYLEKENSYYKKRTQNQKDFKQNLFEEMKSRIKKNDTSAPYFYNDYWYQTRYEKGKEYPIYIRKKETLNAEEEILFDCNKLAKGHEYFNLTGINVSPDNTKVIYAIDINSRRKYSMYIKNLETGKLLNISIKNTNGGSAWAADSKHFFYVKKNPKTLRTEKIYRHNINDKKKDFLVYHEKDSTYSVYVSSSKSKKFIFISSYSTLTSEHQYLNSNKPLDKFNFIQPRINGLEYEVTHFKNNFYILTNHNNSKNYKVVKTPINKTGIENWKNFIGHQKNVLIEDIDVFDNFYIVSERTNGLNKLLVKSWNNSFEDYYIPMKGETYSLYVGYNPQFDSNKIRYVFSSLITPRTVYEYDVFFKSKKVLKKNKILDKTFHESNYIEKRIWAKSRDGEKIPISIVYKKEINLNGKTPLLQYGYGSYGSTIDPSFSSTRLTLLNRGFVYAISHIRGSEYLGRDWYENGKLLKKWNTFNDFIDCSKFLIENKYTNEKNLHAYGGSAGGLLMGVVANKNPELYSSIIAAVPFVDVMTTMLDDKIPLTTSEYDEWGNPNIKKYYDYMKSYSPYDNVEKKQYPNLFVTAGYHDSQVQYWEPAKWVAKLRELKTDKNLLFLKTNMKSGHSGASGRYSSIYETAEKYAFLLSLEGISN